jgi:hypothetical protein
MSNKTCFAFLAAACVVSASIHAQAPVEARSGQQALTALPVLDSRGEIPVSGDSPFVPPGAKRAPAPPLTTIWVYGVGSTNCGWEYTSDLYLTKCDHGGGELRVAILEIGYGANRIASMNGGVLPSSAMYASTTVCVTGGRYTWPCTAGQTVVGFLNEYNVDGNESGTFRYQNTSSNAPWNTVSAQINIL